MRVLIINAESGLGGGPAIIVNSICNTAIAAGHTVLVAYGRQANLEAGISLYRIGSDISVKSHGLFARMFDAQGECSIIATQQLIKRIRRFKPDLINLHNIHGYYLNYPMLFKYVVKNNIPVVWTLHDCWSFTGHCAYYDKVACAKWKTECYNCPQSKSYPKSWLIDRSRNHYRNKKRLYGGYEGLTIVTPSTWLMNEVKQSFLKERKGVVIHNGINLDKYHPIESDFKRASGLEGKHIVLGVAAIWAGRKGLEDFIRLSRMLPDEYVIVLVGLSEKERESLPDNMVGLSRTENVQKLIEIYIAADVFVNASSEDNFPTVIMEALACGTPVVTYDTGGSKESLDESCGICVPCGNIEALSDAVIETVQKGDVGDFCLSRIKLFDERKKYAEYVNLFESTLNRRINK